jgi:hypothetical protein
MTNKRIILQVRHELRTMSINACRCSWPELFTLLDAVPGSPENVLVADHLAGAIVETVQPEFMAGLTSNLINYVDIRNRGDDLGAIASSASSIAIFPFDCLSLPVFK